MKRPALAARYSAELRGKFGFWPTWLPDAPIAVGDFGRVEKGVFVREGQVGDLGIATDIAEPRAYSDQLFASKGVRHVLLGVGVSDGSSGAARARIDLGHGFGVFVGLRECQERRVADMIDLAANLSDRRESGQWDDDRCVVTSVINAEQALIAIGSDHGGSLELAASAPAPDLLTLLGAEISIVAEASVSYRSRVAGPSTPLCRLSRLSRRDELIMRGDGDSAPRLRDLDPGAEALR